MFAIIVILINFGTQHCKKTWLKWLQFSSPRFI